MPLIAAPTDVGLKIARITVDGELKKRLSDLGILPGEQITVVNVKSGNVIIRLKEGRIALDRELAGKIFVA